MQLQTLTPKRGLQAFLQPTQAWVAILGLIFLTAISLVVGAGSILRFAFPLAALGVGYYLFKNYPVLYLGFTWWLWFLTAWVARLVDYEAGWDDQRIMLVTPFLVTMLSGITVIKYLPRCYLRGGAPFALGLMGVSYGFFFGLVQYPAFSVIRALLDWLMPILFGFHLYINWREYPVYRQNLLRVFLWGVLIMGAYGIFQYLVAPEWDRYWLISSEIKSMGSPVPRGIRVFGTLNSTGPYSTVMMTGLMLLFANASPLKPIVAGFGYLGFLLCLVRSSWGGWFLSLLVHLSSLNSRLQMRLIGAVSAMTVCVIPLIQVEPFASAVGSRLQSLTNITSDHSFVVRTEIYESGFNQSLFQGMGNGLGAITRDQVIDSGIIELLQTLGWMGMVPYLGGLLLLLAGAFRTSESCSDPVFSVSRAVCVTILLQMVIASTMLGISGMILWGFLGLTAAAREYYAYQRYARPSVPIIPIISNANHASS